MSPTSEADSHRTPIKGIEIRAAKPDDLPAVLALERAAPSAAHWSLEHYRNRIERQPQCACFLVAEWKGQLCGFLCVRIVAGEWEIENVIVDPNLRRQGIGALIMQSLIRMWQEAGGTDLLLEVRDSNAAARALYERHGLREVGRRCAYYRDPVESAILYTLHR